MEKKDFRYYLLYKGAVIEIPQAPIGYEDTTVSFKRDLNFWGVIRSFSFPLKFVLAGGEYLEKVLLRNGVDALISLRVDRLNYDTQEYSTIYKGELDLSEAVIDNTGIEIPIMSGDLQSKIKAYEKTPFEFNLDSGGVDVELFGTDFKDIVTTEVGSYGEYGYTTLAQLNIVNSEIETGEFNVKGQFAEVINKSGGVVYSDLTESGNYFLWSDVGTSVNLKGAFNVTFDSRTNRSDEYYYLAIGTSLNRRGDPYTVLFSTRDYPRGVLIQNESIDFDFDLVLQPGVKYFFIIYGNNSAVMNPGYGFTINRGDFRISKTGTTDSTIIKAFKPKDLYDKLINNIRPATSVFSELLSDFDFLITSGDAIRGLPNPKLKTSFLDFYKSIDAIYSTGFSSHDNKAVLEKREFFFRNTFKIADLDNIKDLRIQPFNEIMYSNIQVGYPEETYDDKRGREEFNQGQNWQTPSYRAQNDLDIKSVYRADQFGIEQLLLKNFNQTENDTSTDSKGDNDVFILWVKKNPIGGIYRLKTAADFNQVSGVSDRTYTYNIDLSPKRNLIRHLDFIKSSFWGDNENGYLIMSSAEKNAELSTIEGDVSIVERDPIYLAEYNKRVLIPFVVTFKTNYNRNIKDLIDSTPEGFIRFRWGNYYFSAYIYEITIDLARNSEQEFKLILSKDNNIANLYD